MNSVFSLLKLYLLSSSNSSFFPSDRAAQIELFHALSAIAAEHNLGQGILVKIKFNIIASLYDYNPNLAAFMKVRDGSFLNCFQVVNLDEILIYTTESLQIFLFTY